MKPGFVAGGLVHSCTPPCCSAASVTQEPLPPLLVSYSDSIWSLHGILYNRGTIGHAPSWQGALPCTCMFPGNMLHFLQKLLLRTLAWYVCVHLSSSHMCVTCPTPFQGDPSPTSILGFHAFLLQEELSQAVIRPHLGSWLCSTLKPEPTTDHCSALSDLRPCRTEL